MTKKTTFKKSEKKDIEFSKELIKFYKQMLEGPASSIETLAEIEEKFPDEYSIFKNLKDDPSTINTIVDKAPQDVKDALVIIMLKASNLGVKLSKLFDLTVEEKKQLARDLRSFGKETEGKLNKLIKDGT
ncbi:hypothetical protein M1558_01965 [Candidatus Parvarchaeota archaeon]|jgi:hypothetical protein|nr:hypothetical protein [Candidatus Parvarchaeota archaeon]